MHTPLGGRRTSFSPEPLPNTECKEPKQNTCGCHLVRQLRPQQVERHNLTEGRASLSSGSHVCGIFLSSQGTLHAALRVGRE